MLATIRNRRRRPPNAGPLRCTFLLTSMPVGGAETLLANLMDRMDPTRMVPDVVCLKEPGELGEQIARRHPLASGFIRGRTDVGVVPRLIRHFRGRGTDWAVTVGAGDKMFWGRIAAAAAGVPAIASALHSTGWPDGVGRLNRRLTGLTDAFIAVAGSHGDFLRDFERFPRDKVVVIPNGVDCDRFRPDPAAGPDVRHELGLSPETPLVTIVAALRPEKNHGMFVDVCERVGRVRPDSHFVVVGDGPCRPSIERAAAERGVADRLHLLGTRHDTPRLLAATDVFALTSLNEASPVSILEAMACGVPVVAPDVGSIRESVLDSQTGHLIPVNDADRMTAQVIDLLDNPDRRSAMSTAATTHVRRHASLDSMTEGYQQLGHRLCRSLENHRADPSTPNRPFRVGLYSD